MALRKIPVSLPDDLIVRAKELADDEDRFLSDVIREALEMFLAIKDAEDEDSEDEDPEEEETEPVDDEK